MFLLAAIAPLRLCPAATFRPQVGFVIDARLPFLVQVVRVFGHINGYGAGQGTPNPIQPTPGVYNETALERYDYILDQMAQVNDSLLGLCLQTFVRKTYGWLSRSCCRFRRNPMAATLESAVRKTIAQWRCGAFSASDACTARLFSVCHLS